MNEYKQPELMVLYLEYADVLTLSDDDVVVEPGDDWEA